LFKLSLPYVLATGIIIEDYEERVENFNIHGCWEWSEGKVIIYELPSAPHEICIGRISCEIINACRNVLGTPAEICSLGATTTSKY